jgi:predicted heme/steroid binding protein
MEYFAEVSTTEWIVVGILVIVIVVQLKDIFFPNAPPPVPLVREKKKIIQVLSLLLNHSHLKRDFTLEELKEFTGVNEKPIYLCARGVVYDMSQGSSFYGPGGPYAVFAGHDASKCLATVR